MKSTKLTYSEINVTVDTLISTTVQKYESHAYAAGALGSILSAALLRLSAKEQLMVVQEIERLTEMNKV